MSALVSVMSRVALLNSTTPEGNNSSILVVVEECSGPDNQCLVRTFVSPNSEELSERRLVDLGSLEFYPSTGSTSDAVQFDMDCTNDQYGNYRKRSRNAQKFVLTIRKPTIVRGDFVPLDAHNSPHPTTRIWDEVVVNGEDVDCRIDFEDIAFDVRLDAVQCQNGTIFFRRCVFKGGSCGAHVTSGCDGTAVTFESCLFEQCAEGGMLVNGEVQVTMINCTFRGMQGMKGMKSGLIVHDSGSATLIQCAFINTEIGIIVRYNSKIHMEKCRFVDCGGNSVCVGSGVDATIQDCRITGSKGRGIEITGSKRIIVNIEDSVIEGCGFGIVVHTGKVSATFTNTSVTKCTAAAGVLFHPDVIGDITITNCRITDNAAHDLANVTGPKCEVVIDGVVQPTRLEAVTERVDASGRPIRDIVTKEDTSDLQLKVMRALKIATGKDILCFHCKAVEPADEKFKACAKCENACYCSRECQKAHWKEHKLKCVQCTKVPKI